VNVRVGDKQGQGNLTDANASYLQLLALKQTAGRLGLLEA